LKKVFDSKYKNDKNYRNYAIVLTPSFIKAYTRVPSMREGLFMGYGYGGYSYCGNSFALIVVLFILLIIVGTHFKYSC
jgi:uncharacterized protein (TIGR01732 family)